MSFLNHQVPEIVSSAFCEIYDLAGYCGWSSSRFGGECGAAARRVLMDTVSILAVPPLFL